MVPFMYFSLGTFVRWVVVLLQVPCADALGRKQLLTPWQQGHFQHLFVLTGRDILCWVSLLGGVGLGAL